MTIQTSGRLTCALMMAGFMLVSGCAATSLSSGGGEMDRQNDPTMSSAEMRIEVLGFEGCPNTPLMRERVAAAVASWGVPTEVSYVDQEALPPSDLRRGWPSPTVLVNGSDLFGLQPPTEAAMGCRVYEGGVPSASDLGDALRGWTE